MLVHSSSAGRGNRALDGLAGRLRSYYATAADYFVEAASDKERFYGLIEPEVHRIVAERGGARVLEFGAGRTTFPAWLERQGIRGKVTFAAQDVTTINADFLRSACDRVFFGDIAGIRETFDLILSTFVYEHLVDPRHVVLHCLRLLERDGILFIVSPKYSFPGYVPPALRHLPRWRQLLMNGFLVGSAIAAWISRRPNFWIVTEPALFVTGYRRDADAVHMVTGTDLHLTLRSHCHAIRLRKLPVRTPRDYAINRLALLVAAYRKR